MTYGDLDSAAFNSCDNKQLSSINLCDSLKELNNVNTIDNPQHFSNRCDKAIDTNLPSKTCCKNYTITEFQDLNINSNLNIFHNNINGLETKYSSLHNLLANSAKSFDIIAITETSLNIDKGNFRSHINLEGYINFSSPSNTNKGGTTIYAKNNLDTFERTELSKTHDEFESTWIEIKNAKSKNIVCGTIYRHHNNNNDKFNNFLNYLETSLNSIVNDNKEIYICGDFNIDLHKIDESDNYKRFYELMSSYGLLPQILLPTRETMNSATIIDNIFSNNISNSIK